MSLELDMKILVIDDMGTMRKKIRHMLNQIGFSNIFESDDGSNGLHLIQQDYDKGEPFEFIISDWNMPVMTGLELLKQLRAKDEYVDLPFLMVTAEAEKENVVAALNHGVSNYVIKPFSEEVLAGKINEIFKV